MSTVVQVVQHLRPGGIETMALDLHGFFEKQTGRSYIVSLEGERQSAMQAWPRLREYADRIIFLNKPDRTSPRFLVRLVRQLRALGTETLHTHHIGPLLYGGLAGRLASVKTHIHTEHDAWHLECPRRQRLQQWLLRLSRPVLVADAEAVGSVLRKLFNPKRLLVIPNGIDTGKFAPANQFAARCDLYLPQNVRIIGSAGRLEPLKGQGLLIEALLQMPPDVHVALAGDGSQETSLRLQTESLGLCERVHFLGRIDDMPGFYRALDVFCQPSFMEGMPLAPLEAQACGVPAIVTDVGASRETLCPNSGILIPAGNVDAIAASAKQLFSNQIQTSPRDFVKRYCDFENMAQAYTALHGAAY